MGLSQSTEDYYKKFSNPTARYVKPQLRNPHAKVFHLFNQQREIYEMRIGKIDMDYNALLKEYTNLKSIVTNSMYRTRTSSSSDSETQTVSIAELNLESVGDNIVVEDAPFQFLKSRFVNDKNLKKENEKLYYENCKKNETIQRLENEIKNAHFKLELENGKIKDEFTQNSLMICDKYENEKTGLNLNWEEKLIEIFQSFNGDIEALKNKFNQEKTILENNLVSTVSQIEMLTKQNVELNSRINNLEEEKAKLIKRNNEPDKPKSILEDNLVRALVQIEELTKQNQKMSSCYDKIKKLKESNDMEKQSWIKRVAQLENQLSLKSDMLRKQNELIETLNPKLKGIFRSTSTNTTAISNRSISSHLQKKRAFNTYV